MGAREKLRFIRHALGMRWKKFTVDSAEEVEKFLNDDEFSFLHPEHVKIVPGTEPIRNAPVYHIFIYCEK